MKQNNLHQFKKNLESITYSDILKLREEKSKHAIDLDSLEMSLKLGDEYVAVMQDFLEQLNFNEDRIEAFECRGRSGFIPHSHNNSGLQGITYRDAYGCCQHTGFDNTDTVLAKHSDYNLDAYCDDKNILDKDLSEWTDEARDLFYEYECESDDTVQFQARIMMTSATTANVDFYVSASDTPYHRQSDDKLELEIEFKSPAGMKRKLNAILKKDFVQRLAKNVREGF